jgi:hypothetical protein
MNVLLQAVGERGPLDHGVAHPGAGLFTLHRAIRRGAGQLEAQRGAAEDVLQHDPTRWAWPSKLERIGALLGLGAEESALTRVGLAVGEQ